MSAPLPIRVCVIAGGPCLNVMYVLLTDPACGLLLLLLHATCHRAPLNAASVETRRRIRRLNDSGRIGDVRGESALPSIPDELLHCRNTTCSGPVPGVGG
jgi:hypothetical protein